MKKQNLVWIIIGSVLLLDQILKIWIKTHMTIGQEFYVTSWFRILFLENEGMAFGMSFGGEKGKLILSLLRVVAIVAACFFLRYQIRLKVSKLEIIALAFFVAGAIGNLIDSAFYGMIFSGSEGQVSPLFSPGYAPFLHGRVVDMFYFPLFSGSYPDWIPWVGGNSFLFFRPVFNIADSAITIGVVLYLIQQLFLEHKRKQQTPE